MNPDELDEVLQRSLGQRERGGLPAAGVDRLIQRGRARRRRRQTALAGVATAVVIAGGLSLAARRPGSGPLAADRSTTSVATTQAPNPPVPGPSTTTSADPGGATTTAGTAADAIEIVAQGDGKLYVVRGTGRAAAVEEVDPCAGVAASPCDAPVLAVAPDLWFLRRTPTTREIVHHHDGLDEVVFGGPTVSDFAVGGIDGRTGGQLLYVLYSDRTLVEVDLSLRGATVNVVHPEVARGVLEVVATPDGRLAWADGAGLVVRDADGTQRPIPLPGPPSQLSFAPTGPRLLVRTAAGGRAVVDTSQGGGIVSFDATAACWGLNDATIYVYDGAADRVGHVSTIDAGTGAIGTVFDGEITTAQIACTPSGAVAYVQPDGVLVTYVPGTTTFGYVGGKFERVRSVR